MRGSIFSAAAFAAVLVFGGPAFADAPIDLPQEALAALEAGGRTNVIIMLEEPGIAADVAAISEQAADDRAASIRSMQEVMVERTLGTSLSVLEQQRDGFDASIAESRPEGEPAPVSPVLQRAFRYTPAMAMRLDAGEIAAFAAAPGAARIVENGVTSIQMDESLTQIGANVVQGAGYSGAGQAVAILDTGVDFEHPMTGPALIGSACFSTSVPEDNFWSQCPDGQASVVGGRAGDPCENCTYPSNHGTHVGGTVAGRPYEVEIDGAQRTLIGVAPEAYLVGVNVFGDANNDGQPLAYDSDQIAALEWIIDNPTFPNPEGGDPIPVSAINMSLGGGSFTDFCDTNALAPAILMLRGMGIATVIASGNNGYNDSLARPGCIGAAVTVGAVDRSDSVASFSNSHFVVDLLAPGVGIRSAQMDQGSGIGAVAYNGTSMATPHVAGAFAVLQSAFPEATVDQIEYALKATGRAVTDPDNNMTRPRIQVNLAFEYLVQQFEAQGPFAIAPTTDYFATVDLNRPEQPDVVTYIITNNGGAPVDFAVHVESNDAITFGGGVRQFEYTIDAGNTFDLNIEVDLAAVFLGRNTGEIVITADTGGRPQVLRIRATVAGYTGPGPTERPANDNFSNAFPITDGQAEYLISTYGATTQIGEPDHAGGDNGGSIWYVMEAQRPGQLQLAMQGRLGANTIAVYSGNSIAALQEVASTTAQSDNAELTFAPVAEETYYIALDYNPPPNAFGGEESQQVGFRVVPQAADYDAFATPYNLTASGGIGLLSFGGSTVEDGEPSLPAGDNQGTLWMHVSGHEGEQFTISVIQATNGVALEFFSGASLETLQSIGTSFFSGSNYGERESVAIPAGGLYIRAYPSSLNVAVPNRAEAVFNWQIGAGDNAAQIATAVAPQVRAIRPHQFVTALVAVSAAASGADATECGVLTPVGYPGIFRFMPLTPESGDSGDGVDIPAGQSQIYAFGAQRSTLAGELNAFAGLMQTGVTVACDNGAAAQQTSLNTLYVTLSEQPVPDIIVSSAVTGANAAELPRDGATRFAAAAANIAGVEGNILVFPVAMNDDYPGALTQAASETLFEIAYGSEPFPVLPLNLSVCQTDPVDGTCFGDFASHVRLEPFAASSTNTFSVRIEGQGEDVAFAPGRNRIGLVFVQFETIEGFINAETARLVGGTTVAVRTTPQD